MMERSLFGWVALCTAAGVLGGAWTPVSAQAPMEVGQYYAVRIDSHGRSDALEYNTRDGRAYELHHPGATYIALHFGEFNLPPGDFVIVSDAFGGQHYTLDGKGKMGLGEFWAQHVKGDTVVIEYVRSKPERQRGQQVEDAGAAKGERGFVVDLYAAGFVELGGVAAICGSDDKKNAVCYQNSHPTEYNRGRAVARLLIEGRSLCTGWLASADNHLLTNEHCITRPRQAQNTDYEFGAEAPNCNDSNCQLCFEGTVFTGGDLVQDNAALDYALIKITSGNPAGTFGFLEIDNREAVVGEEIYIPQHAGGRAKEFGIESSDPDDANGVCHVNTFTTGCSSSSYDDVGYQCDTEGGSSGSPVLARSSHKVIALHHCANCPNRGVPINLVCAEVCGLLGGGTGCTGDADCDDGDPCTTDVCNADGTCSNTEPSCGTSDGCCPSGCDSSTDPDCPSCGGSGASCSSDGDCCSNKCRNGTCRGS